MFMKKKMFCLVASLIFTCNYLLAVQPEDKVTTVTFSQEVTNSGYIGNGVQWDPYQLDYGSVKLQISEQDWQKIYHRLDFMRPQLMRVVHNTSSLILDNQLFPEGNFDQIKHILDYCQSRGVIVVFGDWGWGLADAKIPEYDKKKVELAADYVTWLIKEKGYTCIKYYNMINEPNGFWSTTEGNYALWHDITLCFYNRLKKNKMLSKVTLVGPDVAIWTPDEVTWLERANRELEFGLFDIHTYPSKCTVNSGEYSQIIKAYRDATPSGRKIIMGEIGLKFVEPQDSLYQQEMLRRAAARPFASTEDSQMFIFDYMYGTDMADAVIQTANAGYSGSVAWMLDDAMHAAGDKGDQLKMWGFWNILGEEYFGADGEAIRPWFFAWSLLCRYMPTGCDVYASSVKGNIMVKALKVKHDGKTMLAVLNPTKKAQTVHIQGFDYLAPCKQFVFAEHKLNIKDECVLEPAKVIPELYFANGTDLDMPGESLFVFTDFDY